MVNLRLQDPAFKIRDLRKQDLETYQKCSQDFEIGSKFSEGPRMLRNHSLPLALMGNMYLYNESRVAAGL